MDPKKCLFLTFFFLENGRVGVDMKQGGGGGGVFLTLFWAFFSRFFDFFRAREGRVRVDAELMRIFKKMRVFRKSCKT